MATVTYQCPNCGAPLRFDAESQQWACDYCHENFHQGQLDQTGGKREPMTPPKAEPFHGVRYTCPTCGAELVADENTAATFCLYCHSPTLLSERLSNEFKPSYIIPFQIGKEQAVEGFLKWCRKRKFVPGGFTAREQIEKMTGLYVPYWLFDGKVDGFLHAIATVTTHSREGNYEVTRTRYFDVRRSGNMAFGGIPADGSKRMDDRTMEVLEPYRYQELRPFDPSFLSGFFAEKYDVDDQEVTPEIERRMRLYAEQLLRDTIGGYGGVSVDQRDIRVNRTATHYVMMPVWLLTYRHKEKDYLFLMNGQTGKIAGNMPFSVPKLLRFGAVVWAVAAALFTLFGMLF